MSTTLNCGSHGVFNPTTGQCDCMDDYNSLTGPNKWTGVFCQKPPVNIPCVKSSDAFRAAHNGGDESCGNWGQYGVCDEFTGTCSCGTVDPFYGVRCENECTNDMQCGGPLQPLADGTSRNIGLCDRRTNKCACQNGWAGTQCRTEPANAQCFRDADCSWGGVKRGACDEGSHKCSCLTDSQGRPVYTGNLCSQRHFYEGAACKVDKDCEDKSNKCVGGKCKGPEGAGGITPGELAASMLEGIWSPEGILNMIIDQGSEHMASAIFKTTSATAAKALQIATIEIGNALGKAADIIGMETLSKAIAEMTSKAVAKRAAAATAAKAAEIGEEADLGPAGWLLILLQVWTAVLDIYDSQGLNMMVGQGQLDAMQKQYLAYFNAIPQVVDAGVTFPIPYYASYSFPFQQEYAARDNQLKLTTDAVEYISRLTVNSNGQTIVPLFNPPAAIAVNQVKEKYPVYWNMANGNVRVFGNLVQYGWAIWTLGSLMVVSVTLICVFSSPSVLSKLKK